MSEITINTLAKPLPDPVLTCWQLDPKEQISVKFEWK